MANMSNHAAAPEARPSFCALPCRPNTSNSLTLLYPRQKLQPSTPSVLGWWTRYMSTLARLASRRFQAPARACAALSPPLQRCPSTCPRCLMLPRMVAIIPRGPLMRLQSQAAVPAALQPPTLGVAAVQQEQLPLKMHLVQIQVEKVVSRQLLEEDIPLKPPRSRRVELRKTPLSSGKPMHRTSQPPLWRLVSQREGVQPVLHGLRLVDNARRRQHQ